MRKKTIVEAYGNNAPSESTFKQWFRIFKNHEFNDKDKEREGAPKKFEDEDLEAILDEDSCQTGIQLAAALNITQ